MAEQIRLGILGATGMAGREALLHHTLLDETGRQYAELAIVTASPDNVGRSLGEVIAEKEGALTDAYGGLWTPMSCPQSLAGLKLNDIDPELIASKADYIISALESEIARHIEPELARLGVNVFSNAAAFRWRYDIPLLIPEVNSDHLSWVRDRQTAGVQVCNPNCTTAGYVPLVHALEELGYIISYIDLKTQQAISGKGDKIADPRYAERIMGNVIDDWSEDGYNPEEWKSAAEPQKILGRIRSEEDIRTEMEKVRRGEPSRIIPIFSETTRVCTQYGHLEMLTIEFHGHVDANVVKEQLTSYKPVPLVSSLPSMPSQLFYVIDGMPSPKEHAYYGNGMSIVVGDIKQRTPNRISMVVLSHNLRRGATWAGRQGLELYLRQFKEMF